MNVQNIIKASAQVVTIAELSKNDVYKRLQTSTYESDAIVYGIIVDVLNNGEDTVIQGLEFTPSYSDIKVELKSYAGDKDLKIFGAEPHELMTYLGDAIGALKRDITTKEKALEEAQGKLKTVEDIIANKIDEKLLTPPKLELAF